MIAPRASYVAGVYFFYFLPHFILIIHFICMRAFIYTYENRYANREKTILQKCFISSAEQYRNLHFNPTYRKRNR